MHWLAELKDSVGILYRIGRDGEVRVAEWPDLLELRCEAGNEPTFRESPGADPLRLAKVRNGLGRALVRSLAGEITLHGSAVARRRGAIVCLGASGDGKSTLAGALCETHDCQLLADDMAPLAETPACGAGDPSSFAVLPSERVVWLEGAAGDAPKRPRPVAFATEQRPLAAFVALSFSDARAAPRLRSLRAAEIFAHLVRSVVRFALDDPETHARELAVLGRLSRSVQGFELERPRDLARLDESARLLAGLLPQA